MSKMKLFVKIVYDFKIKELNKTIITQYALSKHEDPRKVVPKILIYNK